MLSRRKYEIKRLLERPEKLDHIWRNERQYNTQVTKTSSEDLKLSGHRREDPQSQSNTVTKSQALQSPSQKRFLCNKCDLAHNSSDELEEHIDSHYDDGDFTCDTCLFQSNKIKLLRNHILNSPGHSSGQVRGKLAIKCKLCEEKFIDKSDLIKHKNI